MTITLLLISLLFAESMSETIHRTRWGQRCMNKCDNYRKRYTWCYSLDSSGGWNYCSKRNGLTDYGENCKSPCMPNQEFETLVHNANIRFRCVSEKKNWEDCSCNIDDSHNDIVLAENTEFCGKQLSLNIPDNHTCINLKDLSFDERAKSAYISTKRIRGYRSHNCEGEYINMDPGSGVVRHRDGGYTNLLSWSRRISSLSLGSYEGPRPTLPPTTLPTPPSLVFTIKSLDVTVDDDPGSRDNNIVYDLVSQSSLNNNASTKIIQELGENIETVTSYSLSIGTILERFRSNKVGARLKVSQSFGEPLLARTNVEVRTSYQHAWGSKDDTHESKAATIKEKKILNFKKLVDVPPHTCVNVLFLAKHTLDMDIKRSATLEITDENEVLSTTEIGSLIRKLCPDIEIIKSSPVVIKYPVTLSGKFGTMSDIRITEVSCTDAEADHNSNEMNYGCENELCWRACDGIRRCYTSRPGNKLKELTGCVKDSDCSNWPCGTQCTRRQHGNKSLTSK